MSLSVMSWIFVMLDSLSTRPATFAPAPSGADPSLDLAQAGRQRVVPRRPVRLSRIAGAAPPERPSPEDSLNIFADIFDSDPPPKAHDPRVTASRLRARERLARARERLPAPEANFWHPDALSATDPAAAPAAGIPYSATIPANDLPDLPRRAHGRLARVRRALYHPGDAAQAAPPPAPSPQLRLAAHAMNATLVIVAFPVGAALSAIGVVRGANPRLSAPAIALLGVIMLAWQSGIERFL